MVIVFLVVAHEVDVVSDSATVEVVLVVVAAEKILFECLIYGIAYLRISGQKTYNYTE